MRAVVGSGQISSEMNVDEVVSRYPAAARVFVRRRMACVGCQVARFETVAEACRAYRQPLGAVLAELRQATGQDHSS